ncbi:hypothetical protein VTN31DRAFT_2368 [Thermomyces dupontii]|uniref:uncharacterized protein n=1 Tax=Talaromyces thermophilus TaxID=28565 RepID=UPI0037428674
MADTPYSYKYFNVAFPKEYVAHVEINRPEKLNAFFEAMWLELRDIFDRLAHDASVRAIILSGAGDRAFTTGLDVNKASGTLVTSSDSDAGRAATRLRRFISTFQDSISSLERCEKPVIAVLHGYTFGLGIDIATATDIRLCAQNTRFSVKEVDIGIAADIGTLNRLPKVVGAFGWVKEVSMTARIFDAAEALRVGFVNAVYPDKEKTLTAAIELATTIAAKSPIAVQGTKELLNYSRDRTVEEGLRYTRVWSSAAVQSKDVETAIISGLQKRKPTFEKL